MLLIVFIVSILILLLLKGDWMWKELRDFGSALISELDKGIQD